MERLRKNEICKVIWTGLSQSLQALHIYSKMKNGLNLPELIYTLGILVLDLHWDQKWAGLKVILWKQLTISHWGCSFWFSLLSSQLKMQHFFLIFTDLSITGLWGGNTATMFNWIKWPNESRAQSRHSTTLLKCPGAAPSRMLIRELLFHAERLRGWKQGTSGLSWFHKYPKLQTIITTSELQQLEIMCAQIPPSHAATVLFRYLTVTIPY